MNRLTLAEVQEIMDKTPDMAFPISRKYDLAEGGIVETLNLGLSKREYFAGLAMQGLISAQDRQDPVPVKIIAQIAVMQADVLIAELSKEEE